MRRPWRGFLAPSILSSVTMMLMGGGRGLGVSPHGCVSAFRCPSTCKGYPHHEMLPRPMPPLEAVTLPPRLYEMSHQHSSDIPAPPSERMARHFA